MLQSPNLLAHSRLAFLSERMPVVITDDVVSVLSPLKGEVDIGHIIAGDASFPVRQHVVFSSWAKLLFEEVLVEFPDTSPDVIAIEHKFPPVVSNPTDQQVNVVVVGG